MADRTNSRMLARRVYAVYRSFVTTSHSELVIQEPDKFFETVDLKLSKISVAGNKSAYDLVKDKQVTANLERMHKLKIREVSDNKRLWIGPATKVTAKTGVITNSEMDPTRTEIGPSDIPKTMLKKKVAGGKSSTDTDREAFTLETVDGNVFYPPKWYTKLRDCAHAGEHIYMYGPHGCGKTTLARIVARDLAHELGHETFEECDFSVGVEESSLLGMSNAVVDEEGNNITQFTYGVIPRAMQRGVPLVINEIDAAQPEHLFAIHSVLDFESPRLVLLDNGGEVITPQPGFCVLATANTLGDGDRTDEFHGTKLLNAAFLDRFTSFFEMDYTTMESEIVYNVVRDNDLSKKIMSFVADIRKLREVEEISFSFSTRRVAIFARKVQAWGLADAVTNVLINKARRDDREQIEEARQRNF